MDGFLFVFFILLSFASYRLPVSSVRLKVKMNR
jgi:hypothetical protein